MDAMRLVLIGKTGSGKSLTGNTILGKKMFESSPSAASKSKYCHLQEQYADDIHLKVIDTPGLFDTDPSITNEDTKKELVKCVAMATPGPHAFLLVISKDRFSQETRSTVDQLKELFHRNDFLRHTIIVITGKLQLSDPDSDQFDNDEEALRNFYESEPDLNALVQQCGGGIIAIENMASRAERNREATRIIKRVKELVNKHNGEYFSHEVFELAEKIKKMKKDYDEQIEELGKQLKSKSWWPCIIL